MLTFTQKQQPLYRMHQNCGRGQQTERSALLPLWFQKAVYMAVAAAIGVTVGFAFCAVRCAALQCGRTVEKNKAAGGPVPCRIPRRTWIRSAKRKRLAEFSRINTLPAGHTVDREVINMENIGVTCDVCECCHNVSGCKCDLPQIKVTEQCTCDTQQVETPHYCQSYEKK